MQVDPSNPCIFSPVQTGMNSLSRGEMFHWHDGPEMLRGVLATTDLLPPCVVAVGFALCLLWTCPGTQAEKGKGNQRGPEPCMPAASCQGGGRDGTSRNNWSGLHLWWLSQTLILLSNIATASSKTVNMIKAETRAISNCV